MLTCPCQSLIAACNVLIFIILEFAITSCIILCYSSIILYETMKFVIVISQAGVGYRCYYTRPMAKPEVEC